MSDRLPPFVTVIIPVRNEAAYIERSLSSVLVQDYPSDRIEIIIVDGMSDDETRQIIRKVVQEVGTRSVDNGSPGSPPVTVIDNPDRIVPTALNAAILKARGEIIIRIDGHSLVTPTYVSECVQGLQLSGADCVGGATTSVGETYVAKAIALAVSSPLGAGNSPFRTSRNHSGPVEVETLQFPAFKRDVIDRIGLFNPEMIRHQDYEFHYRLRKNGGKILLFPDVRVQYFVRKNLRALWKQYWQYGFWKGRLLRKHPDSIKIRHLIPPLFVAAILMSLLLGIFSSFILHLNAALLLAYLAYLLICLSVFVFQRNARFLPALLLVLPTLHFSYGLAIWIGLLWKRPKTS